MRGSYILSTQVSTSDFSSDLSGGRRPESKSDEKLEVDTLIHDLSRCEHSFTVKKVLLLFRASVLGVHRPRRQDIPRGRGAPSSRRLRLEEASPLPLLAARPARALPPTRVVRRRYRASALVHGASAAPASSACARLGHERGSGQRPAKSRDFSCEN